MRQAGALIAAMFTLCACGGSSPISAPAQTAVSTKIQLHREGRWMVDSMNRVVLSHGVNAVWKLKPYYPPETPDGFTAADADWLLNHGFNSVRLGVLFAGVMPQQGVIDSAYLVGVDRTVQLLAARGIYTLLDFHQDNYNEAFAGEGFPDWSVLTNGAPLALDKLPSPLGCETSIACGFAFDNLWLNTDDLWDAYAAAWSAVAQKWRHQSYLMGYDLINEPGAGTQTATCASPLGCPLFDQQFLQPFQQRVLDAIRSVDPQSMVWFEANIESGAGAKTWLGQITPLADANLGLSWHNYCLLGVALHQFGFTNLPLCPQLHQITSDNAEQTVQAMPAATLETEFGASDDLPDLTQVTEQADTQLTGWQYWSYKNWHDPTTESVNGVESLFTSDSDLTTVKLPKLKILERTYPQATAGIPLQLSFDPATGEFHYRYAPRAAAAPTEIYVPVALHYPSGYDAEVAGARILSAPGATPLLLENLPGATEVRVTIRAKT